METAYSDPETLRLQHAFGEVLGDMPDEKETDEAWKRFSARLDRRGHYRIVWLGASVAVVAAVCVLAFLLPWKRMVGLDDSHELFASVASPAKVTSSVNNGSVVFATPAMATASVVLSDGTRVMLNANSQLEYPEVFPLKGTREVRLKGEARFEVTKDRQRPFVVVAGKMRTQVLGTVFNVNAYTPDHTSVTLFEGRVRVCDAPRTVKQDIVPGQKALLDGGNLKVVKADLALENSWTSGTFSFDDAPLGEVVKAIGTWYNVGVVFHSSKLPELHVHFSFQRKASVQTIVSVLNDLGIARFTLKNGQIEVTAL